jgi:hypothetical protein
MNNEITGALLAYRDMLKEEAANVMIQPELELQRAKNIHHAALVRKNQLLKRAQKIQSLITVDMQSELDSEMAVQEAYEYCQQHMDLLESSK